MARYLKQMNYAEQKMVVGALEVIGDVTGSGMKTIRKSIDSLSGNVASINTEINNYWSDIANDAVITPGEKKDLRKEINTIERTHAAILSAAEDEGLLLAEEIQSYRRKYDELYDYLFNKLKLFDDSSTNTEIPDTEYFEEVFNNYYVAEILAQNRLAAGLAAATVRTLSNLDQVGMDGEVAIYNGAFYEYSLNEHKWILIDTNAVYIGPVEEEPVNAVIGSFFLAINDGVKLVRRLCARVRENDNARTVIANGKKVLAAIRHLPAGTIYLKTSAGWIPVTNVNDWRYMVAMNDLLKYGYAIPEYVEEHIKSNSGKDYHGAILALEEPEIPTKGYRWADLDNGISYYYNGLQWEISNFKNKDYFCWGGAHNTQYKELSLKRGYVYKLDNNEWRELIPEVASEGEGVSRLNNQEEFMAALTDILKLNSSGPGYFTTVFASAFFGNNASIESLQTKTIELQSEGGIIKSSDFIEGMKVGFRLMSDTYARTMGIDYPIELNGNTHIGGSCIIDGEVQIGADAKFYGSIISGPIYLDDTDPSSESFEVILEDYNTRTFFDWCNGQGYKLALTSSDAGMKLGQLPGSFNGLLGDKAFTYIEWECNTGAHAGYFYFLTRNHEMVGRYKMDSWYKSYDKLPSVTLEQYTPGGKTFKLFNIPTSRGAKPGAVYRDTEGYLRVTI